MAGNLNDGNVVGNLNDGNVVGNLNDGNVVGNLNDGNVGKETEDNDSPDNGLHSAVHVVLGVLQHSPYCCLASVADPDQGWIGGLFDPWIRDGKKTGSGSGINNRSYFRELRNKILWVKKYLKII